VRISTYIMDAYHWLELRSLRCYQFTIWSIKLFRKEKRSKFRLIILKPRTIELWVCLWRIVTGLRLIPLLSRGFVPHHGSKIGPRTCIPHHQAHDARIISVLKSPPSITTSKFLKRWLYKIERKLYYLKKKTCNWIIW
jgi:hypothetical protein